MYGHCYKVLAKDGHFNNRILPNGPFTVECCGRIMHNAHALQLVNNVTKSKGGWCYTFVLFEVKMLQSI